MKVYFPILLVFAVMISGGQVNMQFKHMPGNASLQGLAIAIERGHSERGSKFDTTTGTSHKLSDTWYYNKTVEENNIYYVQTVYEPVFKPVTYHMWHVPAHFGVGSSAVVNVNLENRKGGNTQVGLMTNKSNIRLWPLFMGFTESDIIFNTMSDGRWGNQKTFKSPMKLKNTNLKLEIKMTASHFQVYINDTTFYNFTRKLMVPTIEYIRFRAWSGKDECERLQFLFPV